MNRWDRNPKAPIKTPKECDAIRKELIKRLREISPYPVNFYIPKKISEGPNTSVAPDLLFSINNYKCDICNSRFSNQIFKENTPNPNISGTHRREGIFIAWGKHFRKGVNLNADIVDISPTILYLYGLPIPTDLDGRVLVEGLDEDFIKGYPVRYVDPSPGSPEAKPIERRDLDDVRNRLRGLGYIE